VRQSNNQSLTANRFRWIRNALRALALTGALLALAATSVGARPPSPDPQPFGDTSSAPNVHAYKLQGQHDVGTTAQPKPARLPSPPSGFDWGDAGIGAGAGLAISLIAAGSALSIYRRRGHAVTAINPTA
jgi:hypothetical protein